MAAPASPALVVVGSCNVDLIAYLPGAFPAPGETIFGSSFAKGWGGKGANQCVQAGLLGGGSGVGMVAALGDDGFGREYGAALASHGIDVSGVKVVAGVSTGVAPILVDGTGENAIVLVPGGWWLRADRLALRGRRAGLPPVERPGGRCGGSPGATWQACIRSPPVQRSGGRCGGSPPAECAARPLRPAASAHQAGPSWLRSPLLCLHSATPNSG
jgi:hypothetical protein